MRKSLPLLATLAAGAAVAATPGLAASSTAASPTPNNSTTTVLLPTGDQATASGSRAAVFPAASTGIARALIHVGLGAHNYELPADAVPYLNNGLDPSLFDVTALAATEHNGQLPVSVVYQGNVAIIPGVTITSASGGTATGYLTADSAKQFGAALANQYLADRAKGSFTGPFGTGTAISLAGSATATPARPNFVMRTVTVTAKDTDGKPDNSGFALLYNTDDSNRFGLTSDAFAPFYQGQFRFSVPSGHYAAVATFFDVDASGNNTAIREVSQPDLTINGNTTIALNESAATSRITMVTPRPALAEETGFLMQRDAVVGAPMYWDVSGGPGVPFLVAPVARKVTTGGLQDYPYQRLVSPPGPGLPYEYNLQYLADGTIPAQRYSVAPASLATIDEYYYSDLPSIGVRQLSSVYPFEFGQFAVRPVHPIDLPVHETEYVSGDPSIIWYGGLSKYSLSGPNSFGWWGAQYQSGNSYPAGQSTVDEFNRYPLHTVGLTNTDPRNSALIVPGALRSGDTLGFNLVPFTDNQPGHLGIGLYGESRDTVSGSYELDQNGSTLASGTLPLGRGTGFAASYPVSPATSTMHLSLTATHTGPMYLLSTSSTTDWTWRSTHEQGGTLPQGLSCQLDNGAPPPADCAVEPLLALDYAVGGQRVDGSTVAGPQTVGITVGHLQAAAQPAITGATVQFSTDEGVTWQDATVTGTPGHYQAAFTVPAGPMPTHPTKVSLRVTATDAADGQITETTTDAFAVDAN